jgi:hypothetical protein
MLRIARLRCIAVSLSVCCEAVLHFGESQFDFELGDAVDERVVAVIGHFDSGF